MKINESSSYWNLGDWLHHFTYGVMDDNGFELKKWEL